MVKGLQCFSRVKEYPFITIVIIIGMLTLIYPMVQKTQAQEVKQITNEAATIEVILEREYLDGELSEERVQETIWSMEDFWAYYQDWMLIDQSEERIIFRQRVNDISPLLKVNGYFGISEDGTLNIYEGNPNNAQIIQSFFQVDTTKLKSRQHLDLKNGIPVESREHYNEVLHVFSQYKTKEM
ncbi:intercompartmental signaling factor BofC [Bacillus solitudinis]|uniref:intercompartmental signaling factor BofC n=1 Tax=Bacillus solitudinis TaxID=2014074 RepID=UPI000C24F83B|nr:intercompartmental signaling factor BofC [Bacillus solitudinis]